jgi:hypothetical protein
LKSEWRKKDKKLSVNKTVELLLFYCIFLFVLVTPVYATSHVIQEAEDSVVDAFKAIYDAERGGVRVSDLLVQLNNATRYISEAFALNRTGDTMGAIAAAKISKKIAEKVEGDAIYGLMLLNQQKIVDFQLTIYYSTAAIMGIILGALFFWYFCKRKCLEKSNRNIQIYKKATIAVSFILVLVATYPLISSFISLPRTNERFTELWILDSDHGTENYPFNITVNAENKVYVSVKNHMGEPAYYVIYVKFCNSTQSEPTREKPSSVAPLYEYRFVLNDEEIWEVPFTFMVHSALIDENNCTIEAISLNGKVFDVSCTSAWDNQRRGFFYRLFFELWMYNASQGSIEYHNRFVRLWLNMTG